MFLLFQSSLFFFLLLLGGLIHRDDREENIAGYGQTRVSLTGDINPI